MIITVHSQFHTVVVSSRDTDFLLLLVSHFQRMQCQHPWMKSGTSKKLRYIPIDAVFNKLPSGSASSLLTFHALTGRDTTSHIANHTKRSSWKIFQEHHGLLKNFGIGELTDDTIVFRNICLQNIQCAQNRLYRCSTALVVLQDRETRSNGPNK